MELEKKVQYLKAVYKIGITVLFTNMGIVKFKSQLTVVFFAAVNHLSRPLREQNFSLMGSKGHGL